MPGNSVCFLMYDSTYVIYMLALWVNSQLLVAESAEFAQWILAMISFIFVVL
jgi:hypothetical protein